MDPNRIIKSMLVPVALCVLIHTQCKSQPCTEKELQKEAERYRNDRLKEADSFSLSLDAGVIDSILNEENGENITRILDTWSRKNRKYGAQLSVFTGWLQELQREIEQYVKIPASKAPIISSLPAYDFNAHVIRTAIKNCNRRIVFVNEGVAAHAYGIPRTMHNLISSDVLLNPERSDYGLQDIYFKQNFNSINLGFAALLQQSYVDATKDEAAKAWLTTASVYRFLLAHEYAHDILGHQGLGSQAKETQPKHAHDVTNDEIVYSWAEELEADYFSTLVLVKQFESKTNSDVQFKHIFLWGAEYFFTFADFSRFSAAIDATEVKGDTIATLINLQALVKKYIPKIEYKNLDSLVSGTSRYLPKKPITEDFVKVVSKSGFIKNASSSHPPTELRRAICRIAIERNSSKSSLVSNEQNLGDVYWKNFSKMYSVLKGAFH